MEVEVAPAAVVAEAVLVVVAAAWAAAVAAAVPPDHLADYYRLAEEVPHEHLAV